MLSGQVFFSNWIIYIKLRMYFNSVKAITHRMQHEKMTWKRQNYTHRTPYETKLRINLPFFKKFWMLGLNQSVILVVSATTVIGGVRACLWESSKIKYINAWKTQDQQLNTRLNKLINVWIEYINKLCVKALITMSLISKSTLYRVKTLEF